MKQYGSANHAFETLYDLLQLKGGQDHKLMNITFELTSPKLNDVNTPWRKYARPMEYLNNDFTLNFHQYLNDLSLTVFVGSLDIVNGFCHSQYHFSQMLYDIALKLKCQVGSITYMVTELYIHEEHYNLKTIYENGNQTKSQDSQGS